MNKGICFYWGYKEIEASRRAKAIKKAGFNCVITNADKKFDKENGTIKQQMKWINHAGLKVSSLHMAYNEEDLPYFWTRGINGRAMEKKLVKDVKTASKYNIKNVVVHLNGTPNKVGLKRLKRILKLCDKVDVNLAVENIDKNDCFFYAFDNIEDKHLKFCFDSGHNNVWYKDMDLLDMYLDKLVALHLHDNNGLKDQHTLNKYGTIDWNHIAKELAKLDHDIDLTYEVMMLYRNNEDYKTTLDETYKQACELEELINKYKKEDKVEDLKTVQERILKEA